MKLIKKQLTAGNYQNGEIVKHYTPPDNSYTMIFIQYIQDSTLFQFPYFANNSENFISYLTSIGISTVDNDIKIEQLYGNRVSFTLTDSKRKDGISLITSITPYNSENQKADESVIN